MIKSLANLVLVFLGGLASLIAIIAFWNDYFKKTGNEGQIAVAFLGGLAVYFLVVSVYYQIVWGRKVRYAEVLPHINFGFSYVHDELRNAPPDLDKIAMACERVCTQVTHAFSVIAAAPCSASIKVLAQQESQNQETRLKVLTLARDQQSSSSRNYGVHLDHWIEMNTDFKFLLERISSPRGRYFFSNRLPYLSNYQNTSIELYGGEPKPVHIWGWYHLVRYWQWPLPYKSTIVVPICPAISSKRTQANLIGYLCLDCSRMGAFKKHYDIELMEGVADGLYNLVSQYVKLVEGGGHHGEI